jgi:hypothetical protein
MCVHVGVRVRVRADAAMLMRTNLFLHLEPISHDYDDGPSSPYY